MLYKVRDNPFKVKKATWDHYLKDFPWKIKAFERDGYKCIKCDKKYSETTLHIHHLDKNGKNSRNFNGKENNSLDNLITLCVKCHAKEHNVEFKMNPHIGMMKEMKDQGLTYREIGDEFNISRQRVHQLIKKHFAS